VLPTRCNFTSAIQPDEISEQSREKIRMRMRNQRHLGAGKSSLETACLGAGEL